MSEAPREQRAATVESVLDPAQRRERDGTVLQLDIEEVLELLPHRSPNLLLDRVIALVPGTHAVGLKLVTGNEYGLATRKHGFVFPAPFALELLVQLATIVLHYPRRYGMRLDAGSKGRTPAPEPIELDGFTWLHEVESLEVRREMLIGDRLYASVSVLGSVAASGESHAATRCTGQVHLAGEPYVEAVFQLGSLEALDRARRTDPRPSAAE